MESAVRRPLGLEDGLVGSSGDPARRAEPAALVEFRDPEFRAIPRHVRMFPFQPAHPPTVGAHTGVRIEVRTRDQGSGRRANGLEIDAADRLPGLQTLLSMVFADCDEAMPRAVDFEICVA